MSPPGRRACLPSRVAERTRSTDIGDMAAVKTGGAQASKRKAEKRWGKDAMGGGFTIVPNVLVEKVHALGLEPLDVCIILFLAKFWWEADAPPFPSKQTIATGLGKSARQIQRRLTLLEDLKMITRDRRRGTHGTNTFLFDGLVAKLAPHGREAREEREAQKERRARKRAKLKGEG